MRPAIPRDLPLLTKSDWLALIAPLGRANRALAEYNGMLRRLPNSSLLLSPLRLQEAVLSSRIEGTLATMSEVLQFEAGEPPERESRRQDIEEILNYRAALDLALNELQTRPFGLNLLLKLHKVLLSSVRGSNKARASSVVSRTMLARASVAWNEFGSSPLNGRRWPLR